MVRSLDHHVEQQNSDDQKGSDITGGGIARLPEEKY